MSAGSPISCPYCGAIMSRRRVDELDLHADYSTTTVMCSGCDCEFQVTMRIEYLYSVKKKEAAE